METYGIFKTTRQRRSFCERYRETVERSKSEKVGESACFTSPLISFLCMGWYLRTINADIWSGRESDGVLGMNG